MATQQLPGSLFHFTHKRNRIGIDLFGLMTSKAVLAGRIWVCDITRVGWAIRHVAETHKWNEMDIICLCILTETIEEFFTRHRPGVYYSTRNIKPWHFTRNYEGALQYLALTT